jgi:glycosyltransferase involved in cell wall biosynthesis
MKQQVLYLSYDGMTDPLGQSQVIPYLAGLSKQGYTFHLVSFEKEESFVRLSDQISNQLKANGITWHPLIYTKNPPVISTLYDLHRMKKTSLNLVRSHNIRLVHARSYISGLAALWLQRKTGVRWIFDMRGFYADERVDGGLWKQENPVYRAIYHYFKKKEKQMLQASEAIVSLTEAAKEIMLSWPGTISNPAKITVIPCCADLNHFNPERVDDDSRSVLRNRLQLENSAPVITYLGAIGTWYMLEEMFDFFSRFRKRYSGSVMLFITHEPAAVLLRVAAAKGIPESAIRVYAAQRSEVPLALSLGDVSLFFIKPVFSKKASSPTKQGEIMGMGIPIICNSGVGDTDEIIESCNAGALVDLSDPNSIDRVIDEFDRIRNLDSRSIIRGANQYFSLDRGVELYTSLYQQVLTASNGGDRVHP